jgi:hypothetical protein
MPGKSAYAACFSNHAASFVIGLPRRRQRKILDLAQCCLISVFFNRE